MIVDIPDQHSPFPPRPERLRRAGDVVAEEVVALLGDAQAVDVDPGGPLGALQDDAVPGLLEDLVAGVVAEERLGRLDVLVGDAGQLDVGADHLRVARIGDDRVERRDVTEAVLGLLGGRDVAEPAADADTDPAPVERREGVLQPDPELADDLLGVGQLLAVLVLGQVLVTEAVAEITDVPATVGVLVDLALCGAGQGGLIEGIRDQLTDRVGDGPVLEDALDVEVELAGGHGYRMLDGPSASRGDGAS